MFKNFYKVFSRNRTPDKSKKFLKRTLNVEEKEEREKKISNFHSALIKFKEIKDSQRHSNIRNENCSFKF